MKALSLTIQKIWPMLQFLQSVPMRVARGDWLGRSFGWDRKNRGPMSQQVWHDKDPSLLKGPERQA